jgi:hypothetical protein
VDPLKRHPLTDPDRAVFRAWAWRVAGLYGTLAFIVVCVVVTGLHVGERERHTSPHLATGSMLSTR